MKNSLIDFTKENIKWIASVFTAIGVVLSAVFHLIDYFYGKVFYTFYGLDYVLYEKNINLLAIIIEVLFSAIIFYLVLFLIRDEKGIVKNKVLNIILEKIFFPILFDYIMIILLSSFNIGVNMVSTVLIYLLQLILLKKILVFKDESDESFNQFDLKDVIFIVGFLLVYGWLFNFYVINSLKNKEEYRILDENRVVVDVNKDYYITLKYEIDEEETMHIKRGTQELIDNKNIESELVKYEFVVD